MNVKMPTACVQGRACHSASRARAPSRQVRAGSGMLCDEIGDESIELQLYAPWATRAISSAVV